MIYLAGKISDKDKTQQQANILRFYKKANELRNLGLKVFNPVEQEPPNQTWETYLAMDLGWVWKNKPKTFYFMKHWEESMGARLEHETARLIKAEIIYEI